MKFSLLDRIHIWIIMTYEELKRKYEEFKDKFFRAGQLKQSIEQLDACLRATEDSFTFKVTISQWNQDKSKSVSYEIEIPEKDQCNYIREAMSHIKLNQLRRLEQLGVKN